MVRDILTDVLAADGHSSQAVVAALDHLHPAVLVLDERVDRHNDARRGSLSFCLSLSPEGALVGSESPIVYPLGCILVHAGHSPNDE